VNEAERQRVNVAASANGSGHGPIQRPLALSELLAETIRIYGDRFRAAIGLGLVFGAFFLAAGVVPELLAIPLLSIGFTLAWGASTRLVAGDTFSEAWAQVLRRAPLLAVFTVVASLPFALAVSQLFLILFAVAWLALVGFSIPVAVVERPPDDRDFVHRLAFGLQRSIQLARAEYFHAAGAIAALVIVYVVFGFLLAGLLVGFAENSGVAALTLVQIVLAPFFFLGVAVLYFEQRARAEGRKPS
jgi:hypothetical protein